jgi:hypothetical protein
MLKASENVYDDKSTPTIIITFTISHIVIDKKALSVHLEIHFIHNYCRYQRRHGMIEEKKN